MWRKRKKGRKIDETRREGGGSSKGKGEGRKKMVGRGGKVCKTKANNKKINVAGRGVESQKQKQN